MKITKKQYYAIAGLFHLAQEASKKATRYDEELHNILGIEDGTLISDAIYCEEDLDDALLHMKVEIAEETASENE